MINDKDREFVLERDNYQCVYCGSSENLQIDHKIPRKYGGSDDIENFVTACRTCNIKKNAKLSDDLKRQVVHMSKWRGGHFYDDVTSQVEDEWFSTEREISNCESEILELDFETVHYFLKDNRLVEKLVKKLLCFVEDEDTRLEDKANICMWLIEMITGMKADNKSYTKILNKILNDTDGKE